MIGVGVGIGCGAAEPATDRAAASTPTAASGSANLAPPRQREGFVATFQRCAAQIARATDAAAQPPATLGRACEQISSCGELFGDGPCRASWDTLCGDDGLQPSDALRGLIRTCAGQYCARISTGFVRACAASSSIEASHQVAIWSELHAAILDQLFSDQLLVPPALIERYLALPEEPSVGDFKALDLAAQLAGDPAALVDGRQAVFGIAAKMLAAMTFQPAIALSPPVPLPKAAVVPRATIVDDPAVSVLLGSDGIWLGSSAGTCFRPRNTDAQEWGWLESELVSLKIGFADRSSLELTAAPKVTYQDAVHAMDLARKVGFVDTTIADPGELAVSLPGPGKARSVHHCPIPAAGTSGYPKPGSGPARRGEQTHDRAALADAPSVVVTPDEIRVGSERVLSIKAASSGRGSIPELGKRLSTTGSKIVILQADAQTPMGVILRILATAKAVDKTILFAVKNK
ncbi:MAG: ExbD/TolR family protein [Kofleriaceae bacterium]